MHIANPSRRMKRPPLAIAVALAALVGASAASAQIRNPQVNAVVQACAADVQSLCSGIQPGDGRIKQCLIQNRAKVSATCKQALRAARAARSQSSGS